MALGLELSFGTKFLCVPFLDFVPFMALVSQDQGLVFFFLNAMRCVLSFDLHKGTVWLLCHSFMFCSWSTMGLGSDLACHGAAQLGASDS